MLFICLCDLSVMIFNKHSYHSLFVFLMIFNGTYIYLSPLYTRHHSQCNISYFQKEAIILSHLSFPTQKKHSNEKPI